MHLFRTVSSSSYIILIHSIYLPNKGLNPRKYMAEAVKANGEIERKVMVAIDESEYSHYALIWVLDNLKESITKSPLVIFMAQPPPHTNYTFPASLGSARMYCPVSPSKCSYFLDPYI